MLLNSSLYNLVRYISIISAIPCMKMRPYLKPMKPLEPWVKLQETLSKISEPLYISEIFHDIPESLKETSEKLHGTWETSVSSPNLLILLKPCMIPMVTMKPCMKPSKLCMKSGILYGTSEALHDIFLTM